MKKFAKILFAALLVASVLGLSSCNWNLGSELAGNDYVYHEDELSITLRFGKKNGFSMVFEGVNEYQIVEISEIITGTYKDNGDSFVVNDLEFYSIIEGGMDVTALIPTMAPEMVARLTADNGTEVKYTLVGDVLYVDNLPGFDEFPLAVPFVKK